jgi:hypothetical protein
MFRYYQNAQARLRKPFQLGILQSPTSMLDLGHDGVDSPWNWDEFDSTTEHHRDYGDLE